MKRFILASSILALCGSAMAQTNYVSSPPGFLTTEGGRYGYYFGGFADARFQFFDGNFRNKVMLIKEVSYRLDDRNHTTSTAMGRHWKKVTLHMSECDYSKIGPLASIFTLNPTNTPTQVFSGSVTWPSQVGNPSTTPAPWDIKFPCKPSYVHVGTGDILLDYDFSGGTLANNAQWSTTRSSLYWLDGYVTGSFASATQNYHGNSGTGTGCIDSNQTNRGAYNYFYFYTYGPTYSIVTYRNKFRMFSRSYYTGKSAPVAHAYSLGGSAAGVAFPGVTCNRLHVNPATIFLIGTGTANASGYTNVWPVGSPGLIPYIASAVGAKLFSQAAWDDTRTKALRFTRGVSLNVPGIPKSYRRQMVYQQNGPLKKYYGYGPYDYFYFNPIARYCY